MPCPPPCGRSIPLPPTSAASTRQACPAPWEIIDSAVEKKLTLQIRFPEEARRAAENGEPIWEPLAQVFRAIIHRNRSTLFFANSRRLAEKVVHRINDEGPAPLAYSHHGSLAREVRLEVERRLKAGELRAIVATNSLEMGIDIGALDEVVLLQSPPSIASTLQRIGRSGHRVGETARGTLFPTHAKDLLEGAVLSEAVTSRDIEPLVPMRHALDLLAQLIVALSADRCWPLDQLYGLLTRSAAYRALPREQFDLVVDMLAGRYAGSRIRTLKARVTVDRVNGTVQANRGAVMAYYSSGGTIPDRGYFQLRHAESGATIGELDEEFVWEASLGQVLTMGAQNWQIVRITHNDVLVRPASSTNMAPPFWRAEPRNRSFHFSERIGEFLAIAEDALRLGQPEALEARLATLGLDRCASEELLNYLTRQRTHTRAPLPHRHHLLVEQIHTGPGGYRTSYGEQMLVLHTGWGGRVNRPIALALKGAWREHFDGEPEIVADDDSIVIQQVTLPPPEQVLTLVTPDRLKPLLRSTLEGSGFFGARFRECAGRALVLSKAHFKERLPLWMSRLQAKKLMTAVKTYADFPVLLESWRTCLEDEFDLPAAEQVLDELQRGEVAWSFVQSATPSPFAANITWSQINRYMYADDTPERDNASGLSEALINQAIADPALRPTIRAEVVAAFEAKRQRTAPGYEPGDAEAWAEWISERVLLPEQEWPEPVPEHPLLHLIHFADQRWLVHRDQLLPLSQCDPAIVPAEAVPAAPAPAHPGVLRDERAAAQLLSEFLSFYGPRTADEIHALVPHLPTAWLHRWLEGDELVSGELIADVSAVQYCDTENFEILLRFQRAADRPVFTPRPVAELPGFLATWQGFGTRLEEDDPFAVLDVLERLRGYAAPVAVWLRDLLAARCSGSGELLDRALAETDLRWWGSGKERISMGYPEDLALLGTAPPDPATASAADHGNRATPLAALFTDPRARYDFTQLADQAKQPLSAFNDAWWQAVWDGHLAADGLAPLRAGLDRKFTLAVPGSDRGRGTSQRQPGRRRGWRSQGWPGIWQLTAPESPLGAADDPLELLEAAKERARLLLDRYGVLCRELAQREAAASGCEGLRWRHLFRALSAMELAGEVVAGLFFEELSGPQFAVPRAVAQLTRHTPPPELFWCSALDPAAPTGLGLGGPYPARRTQNYLVYHQGALALVAENLGRRLQILLPPDHPQLDAVLELFQHLTRTVRRLTVETINDEPARGSPYLEALGRQLKRVHDHKQVYFERIA